MCGVKNMKLGTRWTRWTGEVVNFRMAGWKHLLETKNSEFNMT